MSYRGLLLTMTEPPPPMEEEFNAWYDDEHLPERQYLACEQAGAADPNPLAGALLMVAAEAPIPALALAELAWDGTPTLPAAQRGWFMRLCRAYGA